MATFKTSDDQQMIITCSCGCDEGLRVQINNDDDDEIYCYQTYLSSNWFKEQKGFGDKLRKIWRILINKDYCYSEICLTREDWIEYKKWINEH